MRGRLHQRGQPRAAYVASAVLLGALAVLGWAGFRWWTSDEHRAQEVVERLHAMPGVESAEQRGGPAQADVRLAATATASEVQRVLDALDGPRGGVPSRSTVAVGRARLDAPWEADDRRTAPALVAMAQVDLPDGSTAAVSVGDNVHVRVRLADTGSAIDAARASLTAFTARPVVLGNELMLDVVQPAIGPSPGRTVSVTDLLASTAPARVATLGRARALETWHPDLSVWDGAVEATLRVDSQSQAQRATAQARAALGPHAAVRVRFGGASATPA